MHEPTDADRQRDLAVDLARFLAWGRGPLLCPEVGWYQEAGAAGLRRALAAERDLARLKLVPGDERHELEEDLLLLEAAARPAADGGGGPSGRHPHAASINFREVVRRDCFERWPVAARRALAAEARVKVLEEELAESERHSAERYARLSRAVEKLAALEVALDCPPSSARFVLGPDGLPVRLVYGVGKEPWPPR